MAYFKFPMPFDHLNENLDSEVVVAAIKKAYPNQSHTPSGLEVNLVKGSLNIDTSNDSISGRVSFKAKPDEMMPSDIKLVAGIGRQLSPHLKNILRGEY